MSDNVSLLRSVITGLVVAGGVLLYVILYFGFLKEVVDAPAGEAPNLDNANVQLAAAIGGLLGGVFAIVFGIQRQDPTKDEKKLRLGATLTPRAEWVTLLCLIAYFLVGLATVVVVRANGAESPQELQTSATVFAGYVASIFAAAVTGPGKTQ